MLYVYLSLKRIRLRRKHQTALGDGGVDEIIQARGARDNFSSYTPLFLILLTGAKYNGLPFYVVHGLGVAFLLGVFFHAYAFLFEEKYEKGKLITKIEFRVLGVKITLFSIIAYPLF